MVMMIDCSGNDNDDHEKRKKHTAAKTQQQ